MRLIVLFAIVAMVSCRDEAFFASLRDTEFGKTIIQTLQLHLTQEHPADNIVNMLKQMKDDLNNEQRVDDEEVKGKLTSCSDASTQAQGIIQVANEKKAEDEERLPLLQGEQKDKLSQLESKRGEEQRNLDRIAQLENERAVTRKEYEERRDELVGLISALQEAKQILNSGLKGNSFVELKNHHLNFQKYYPNKKGFHTMVELLLQMLQNEGGALDKVIGIIDNLVDSIFQVQKEEMKADDAREADFLKQKERFLLANRRLEGGLADLLALSEKIGQKILELKNDIETQNLIVDSKTLEKNDWEKTCKDTERSYNNFKEQRQNELDIIIECIEIFETRFDMETKSFVQRIRV